MPKETPIERFKSKTQTGHRKRLPAKAGVGKLRFKSKPAQARSNRKGKSDLGKSAKFKGRLPTNAKRQDRLR